MKTMLKFSQAIVTFVVVGALGWHAHAGAATLTVSTLADGGAGSLREAIGSANTANGPDTIEFAVAGTIDVLTSLPPISDATGATTLDGTSAPGYVAMPVVVIRGSGLPIGLDLRSAGNRVQALSFVSFTTGIEFRSSGNTILDCDVSGAGSGTGVFGRAISNNNLIQGVVASNRGIGIDLIAGSSSGVTNVISGNTIEDTSIGIRLRGSTGGQFHFSPEISNNDVSGASQWGIDLQSTSAAIGLETNDYTGNANGLSINASTTVENVDFTPFAIPGTVIRIFRGSGNTIRNVNVSGTGSGTGILGTGIFNNNLVESVDASDRSIGVDLVSGSSSGVTNAIRGNSIENTSIGIRLRGSTGGQFHFSPEISNNDVSGASQWGIDLQNTSAAIGLETNDYTDDANGLSINSSTTVQSLDFTPFGIPGTVLRIFRGGGNTIRDVNVSGTGSGTGVLGTSIFNNNLIQRVEASSRSIGIDLISGSSSGVTNYIVDSVAKNTSTGIRLRGSTAGQFHQFPEISGSDVSGSGPGTGLDLSSTVGALITAVVSNSRSTGIRLANSTDAVLSCVELLANSTGFLVSSSSGVDIVDSQIESNGLGIANQDNDLLTAESNYWGDASGPSNLGGVGDSFSGNVDADPFLTVLPACLAPVVADAGPDQMVNEGEAVALDGTASSNPQGGPLNFDWSQVAGVPVVLVGANTATPGFDAPYVASNRTLTFQLVVNNGTDFSVPDTMDLVVKQLNNPPVADAGDDGTVKEGASGVIDGGFSFDPDGDPIAGYLWTQVDGPVVALLPSAAVVSPNFTAPNQAGSRLVFKLQVTDGKESSVPSSGPDPSVADTVAVDIVLNSPPVADAGFDQTKNEGEAVQLDGGLSSDPDGGDVLSHQWFQIGGIPVVLDDIGTATPSFDAPPVAAGGSALMFELRVNDNDPTNPLSSDDQVIVNVLNINDPPSCHLAEASPDGLWPPNHKMKDVEIQGVMDADSQYNTIMLDISGVTQDEPVKGLGDGDSSPDAIILSGSPTDSTVIRAERSGSGNGRVYRVDFTATDGFESCAGHVKVTVPHDRKDSAIDDGQLYDATLP